MHGIALHDILGFHLRKKYQGFILEEKKLESLATETFCVAGNRAMERNFIRADGRKCAIKHVATKHLLRPLAGKSVLSHRRQCKEWHAPEQVSAILSSTGMGMGS